MLSIRHLAIAVSLCFQASCMTLQPAPTERLDTTLNNWQNVYDYGEAALTDDGIALMSTANFFYLSKQQYSDFELDFEIKMPQTEEYSNSGMIFRAQIIDQRGGRFAIGYQAEVDPSERRWSGGLYEQGTIRKWLHPIHKTRSKHDANFINNLSPQWDAPKQQAYKHLEWNHYKVRAVGHEIKIWVNDVLTTHVIDEAFRRGYIGLQHHGSKAFETEGDRHNTVHFRNIYIKSL